MNIKELRSLSREELRDKLILLKKSIFEMNCQKKTGRLDKPALMRQTRKDIARVLTILKEKEHG